MRVLIVPNPTNPRSLAAVKTAVDFLTEAGHEPVLAENDASACGLGESGVAKEALRDLDLAVALGGDGTVLKTVGLLDRSTAPILGVNLGRLGFLSAAGEDRLTEALGDALAGACVVERRRTIEARVAVGGEPVSCYRALNDVFVGRGESPRSVEIEVQVNGIRFGTFMCDGIIVATPTGSTAYALSAGGPLLSPEVEGMVLVAVAPHTLRARPIVLGPADRVRLCPLAASDQDVCVSVDGVVLHRRGGGSCVEVALGDRDVRLLRSRAYEFYGALARTFFGA